MTFDDFHFLRPLWLLALLLLIPLLGWAWRRTRGSAGWERICEPHLLNYLLTEPGGHSARWPMSLFLVGWVATCIALAGPTWQELPQLAFEQPSRTVFVLGLSPSMNQRDVAPSRLTRARHKMLDAIDQVEGGSVALVVYREEAFPVTPLTDDIAVLRELIPILDTGLTPGRSVFPARGIELAKTLLEPVGLSGARIVLVTDGADDDPVATRLAAAEVARKGVQFSVLGIAGKDAALASLATAGRGRFAPLQVDDGDLDSLLGDSEIALGTPLVKSEVQTDEWQDMGVWFAWIPLLLAPLAFRKGWAAAVLLVLMIQLPADSADAGIRDWFETSDQRATRAFEAGEFDTAVGDFRDPAWQAAARYRAGDFAGASNALAERDDPDSQYNRGNALAKVGRLTDAIEAYEQALVLNPQDEDARFNLELVQKLLDEQKAQQDESSSDASGESTDEDQGSKESGSQQPSDSGDSGESSDKKSADSGSSAEQGSGDGQDGAGGADTAEIKGGDSEQAQANANPNADADEGGQTEQETGQEQAADISNDATHGKDSTAEASSPEAGQGSSATADDVNQRGSSSSESELASNQEAPGSSGTLADAQTDKGEGGPTATGEAPTSPADQDLARWTGRLPDDPGGLLREKIRRDYLRKQTKRLQRTQQGGRR